VSAWPFYVVDWTTDKMPPLLEKISRAAAKLGVPPVPPSTLIVVAALTSPSIWLRLKPPRSSTAHMSLSAEAADYRTQFLVL
jgi:hypothetical protein